ncbi:MAG: Ig-like domain-containing protein, partial [Lachnospiraceae bacterium]|nr:Ig-like domain-containing protein [Lachnospiraceae bacterium]
MKREGRISIRLILVMFLFAGILCLAGTMRTPAASIKKITMVKGQVRKLKKKGAKWSTSRKKVAVVDSVGNVTALKKGTAVITAKVGKKKTRYRIKVQAPKLGKTSRKVEVGKSFSL